MFLSHAMILLADSHDVSLVKNIIIWAAPWLNLLNALLPPLGCGVRVSVFPCEFRGERSGAWIGYCWRFPRFPLPQISFHHFYTLLSFISFHLISSAPAMCAPGLVRRNLYSTQTFNKRTSSYLIPLLDPVTETS